MSKDLERQPFDGIFVLGSQMEFDLESNKWVMSTFKRSYEGLVVAGNIKAEAVHIAYLEGFIGKKETPGRVFVTGGIEEAVSESGRVLIGSRAVVLRDWIVRETEMRIPGVRYDQLPKLEVYAIGSPKRGHTEGNADDIADCIQNFSEIGTRFALMSFGDHIRRFSYFWERHADLGRKGISYVPLSIEELLTRENCGKYGLSYDKELDELKVSEEWMTYVGMERKGIRQLEDGTYRFRGQK